MKVFASGLSVVLACIVPQAVVAQTTPNSPSSSNKVIRYPPNARVKPGAYIVELEGEPSRTNFGSMESRLRGLSQVTVDKQFKSIFNGFSVKTRKDFDPAKLASIPGVKTVWPVAYRTLPVQPATQNLTYPYLHQMTGVAKVNQELGFTGKGIKIGIIDSGVDYNHPELGACWKTPGCLWQNGADLIGDHYDPSNPNPTAAPDPDPMDCDGHGTHVAGIIGAQGPTVYGVAPGATLGMYRVFSCPANGDVSSSDDIILAGIEAAYKDGNDILSLSLGGGGWPEDPLSVVCSKLTKKGVVVVVANGNEGSAGLYTSGSPGLGRGVINVGSVDNWNNTGSEATVTRFDGKRSILISTPANQLIPFVFDSSVPIAAPTDSTGSALGCNRFNASLAGKIALISRGNCTFTEKSVNAQDAGAIGVIIYNNSPGIIGPSAGDPVAVPVVGISQEDGKYILKGISSGTVSIKAPKGGLITVSSPTGGLMSSFSSYGPSPDLDIAPLISGPGGNIYSTYPLKLGKYASLSGTSMSTPYISGTVALLKQARPGISVDQIRGLLAVSARPLVHNATGKNIHPYRSGAGLVNIYDAITARAAINPPTLSINDTNWGSLNNVSGFASDGPVRWAVRTVTIKNTDTKKNVSVSFANSPADSLSSYTAGGNFTAKPRFWPPSAASVDNNTVPQAFVPELISSKTVAAGQERHISVFIVAPFSLKESDKWYYGGFLNFTLQWDGENVKTNYVVPYAGFNGNYRKLDVLSAPGEGLPSITDSQGNPVEDLSRYRVSSNKTLTLNYRLEVPSRAVKVTLVDSMNKTLGYLPYGYSEYVVRNQQSESFFTYPALINGTVFADSRSQDSVKVPAGQYHARVSALRPLGRIDVDSDYQTWDSPAFSIT